MAGAGSEPGTGAWPDIAVFGAGAVGCHYGAKLALAGAPVTLIGRGPHVAAIRERGLWFDSGGARTVVRLAADTSPDPVDRAGLVLLCVKSADTAEAARAIAARLRPGATVVSMQNGVDNVERARAAAPGLDPLAAVVYVGASMGGPGHVVHAGRGDLVLGAYPGGPRPADAAALAAVAAVAAVFERAGVACPVSADVRAELWTKLVMNATFNALSALTRGRYGPIVADAGLAATARVVIDECVAVARADGVAIADGGTLHAAALTLGAAMAGATSSTEQDLARGRATEIDSLNGYVVARGDAVAAALARLDARPRVVLSAEVTAGRPADGVHRFTLHRDGGTERWVLDGRALRTAPAEGRTSDALRLAPEGGCERDPDDAADARPGTVVLRYDAWAERGHSRVTLRVDAASGLPRDGLRDGPELAWGRALSRPTKPPQAALRPTGARLLERLDFDYPPPPRPARRGTDTGEPR